MCNVAFYGLYMGKIENRKKLILPYLKLLCSKELLLRETYFCCILYSCVVLKRFGLVLLLCLKLLLDLIMKVNAG